MPLHPVQILFIVTACVLVLVFIGLVVSCIRSHRHPRQEGTNEEQMRGYRTIEDAQSEPQQPPPRRRLLFLRRSGCQKIHLPWRKCPNCTIDPPRGTSLELPGDSLPVTERGAPHELQAAVPAWQADPNNRMTLYGNFYGPQSAPPRQAGGGTAEGRQDGPSNRWTNGQGKSAFRYNTEQVGAGHISFPSYAATSAAHVDQQVQQVHLVQPSRMPALVPPFGTWVRY